jgi:hypothetical protein
VAVEEGMSEDIYSLLGEPQPFNLNEYVYTSLDKNAPVLDTNKHRIYIPSKGRATKVKTSKTLEGLNYVLVVEPQDYDDYCKVHPSEKVLCMDKNDQGLAYVRNFIKKYSTEMGESSHWQMDDDIEYFKIRPRGHTKNKIISAILAISIVEDCHDKFTNVAISGICADAFAFSKKYAVQKNRLAYQCVLVNNSNNLEWDMGGVEDWYYTFTVLEHGYCTLSFHHIMTQTSPTMQTSGGFSGDKRKILYEEFIRRWPGRFIVKEYPDSKKRWRLQAIRKFFNDYKQEPILKTETTIL